MPTQSHLVKQTLPIHAITDVQASRGGLRMVRNVSGYGHLIRQNCQLWNPNIPNHVPPKGQIHWCSRSWVPMPVHSEGLQKVRKLSETKLKCWCLAGSRVSRAHRTKCANHCKSIYYFDWKSAPSSLKVHTGNPPGRPELETSNPWAYCHPKRLSIKRNKGSECDNFPWCST